MRRLAAAAAILGLGAGSALYIDASKSVTLTLDGRSQQVSTMDTTVEQLLNHRNVTLSSYDRVTPSPSTGIREGQTITIDFARPVQLSIDGVNTTTWTTARTVRDVLAEKQILKTAWVDLPAETAIEREGIALNIRMPKKIVLTVNKKKATVTTTAANVDQLLRSQNITLGSMDRSVPSLTTPLAAGMKIKIVRVYQKVVSKVVTVKYPITRINDKTMLEGKRITKVRGANGKSKITYRITFADGKVESKKAVKTVVLTAPKKAVIVYGTKKRTLEELNWAALAWCESRNHPTSVSRNKLYYGLYQFSLTAWKSVGGSGKPSEASREEQLMRAKLLYQKRGKSPWPVCGRRLFS